MDFSRPMSRILIVTNGPLARNPRVVKEASALGAAGHQVTVLTPRNHPPSEPYDRELCEGAPFLREPITLIPGHGLPSWRIFLRLLPHRIGRELMTRFRWENSHALGPAGVILNHARAHPADLTIVHNEVPHGVGLRLLAGGRRVAADIEDWHSEDLPPEARRHRPLRLLRRQEGELLHRAAYCITTSEAMAEGLFARYGGRRPSVITNSFPLGPARARQPADGPPRLLWFSQTIGPGRGLEAFIDAWGRTRAPSRLVLLGEDRGGYGHRLRERLPDSHRDRLALHPLVSPAALPAFIADHDVGLALEPTTPANKDLTISNKILQYLGAGLAVVATPTAGQREVLGHAPEAGVVEDFADAAGAARRLDELLADTGRLIGRQAAARRLAETRYCWEREAPRLLALVEKALAGKRT